MKGMENMKGVEGTGEPAAWVVRRGLIAPGRGKARRWPGTLPRLRRQADEAALGNHLLHRLRTKDPPRGEIASREGQ